MLGDCLERLKELPDNSIDAIVTDPPYGLSFMGKKWDYDVPAVEVWAECLRVLKPGGHLLAFAGTRTQHRMAVRIEDAGFEIRDMIAWVYGSGFPKSHNGKWGGTALKPALEPITMARKPLAGTVEANWRQHGTGALNIDGCRVGTDDVLQGGAGGLLSHVRDGKALPGAGTFKASDMGRWPANLIHDGSDEVLDGFPHTKSGTFSGHRNQPKTKNAFGAFAVQDERGHVGDEGSAARFFYCAKASKRDRDDGLECFTVDTTDDGRKTSIDNPYLRGQTERRNTHPTVKPTDLMRYLCRLVTPAGGVVLDPFMGRGSTGKAAMLEGFLFVGIERDEQYIAIAEARIAAVTPKPAPANDNEPQLDMFAGGAA